MLKNLNEKKNIRHPEKINKPDNISPSKPSWLKVRAPIGKIFDETNLKCDIQELPCGTTFSYNFFVRPESIDQPIIIEPDSNSFFLRIQNKLLGENSINSVLIQANDNIEECNSLSIQNDKQVYSLGYFNLDNDLYQQGKVEIITRYDNNTDTTKLTFFNESILIDTLIIN